MMLQGTFTEFWRSFCLDRSRVAARLLKIIIAGFALALLAGCRIEVIAPKNGMVITNSGNFTCAAGGQCEIKVTDDQFEEAFIAVPNPGYAFSHWKRGDRYFCAGSTASCQLSTASFGGTELMNVLKADETFRLQPVFVRFNSDYWAQVLKEIDSGGQSGDNFLFALKPDTQHCDPGQLSDAARKRTLKAVNEVRALHSLPAVDYARTYDMETAAASLVQSANNYLTHHPSPTDNCYTAAGARGAQTSNLFKGRQSDPASDIFTWTNDNVNSASGLAAAGHRRWVLYPGLGQVSYGQAGGSSALKVFGFDTEASNPVSANLEYVAVPHKMYPYVLVSNGANPTPWSISMMPQGNMNSTFDYFRDARVSVKKQGKKGKSLAVKSLYSDTQNYGLANFLSWMVEDWQYDTDYVVTVSKVRMPGGDVKTLSYPVRVVRDSLL